MKIVVLIGVVVSCPLIFLSLLKSSSEDQEIAGCGQPVLLSCHQRLWYVLFVLSILD